MIKRYLKNINKTRLLQHGLFWLFVYVLLTVIYTVNLNLPIALRNECFYVPVHMLYYYTVAEWLVPKYLFKNRYVPFVGGVLIMIFLTAFISRLIAIYLVDGYIIAYYHFTNYWDKVYALTNLHAPFLSKITQVQAFINSIKTMNMVIWVALGIKFFKLWIERKHAATQAELSALKGQIHPHFLFNTLNNLYALTLVNSPRSPQVVMGLSDLLRYMLYECNADQVSLKQEVLMLQQYISLEKIRYEERLDLTFTITGLLDDKTIAPLILLPFIENAFKHGTSNTVGQAWINIDLALNGNVLKLKVSNSKSATINSNNNKHHGHIGLQNVRKRLNLLYPATHNLKIMDDEDVFLIVLDLQIITVNKKAKHLLSHENQSHNY